jgi:inosine-uridine nucleoside N-ribohydrolase
MRKEPPWDGDWQYGRAIAEGLGVSIVPEDVPDTTSLYRRLLAAQPNSSVTVVTVGPLGNILSLLESGADEYSSLTGANLVQEKVDRFVIMGGQYPSGDHEWNFDGGMPGVTRRVLEGIDVPIVFSGYEVGNRILTGQALNTLHAGHPLYLGYRHFSEHAEWMRAAFDGDISDNASYDQTAVLYAVRGGVGRWWNLSERGRVIADDNGGNRWVRDPEGTHRYLELAGPPQDVADVILAAMLDGRP